MNLTDTTELVEGVRYRITVEGQEDEGGLVGTYLGDLLVRHGGTIWDFGQLGPGAFVFTPEGPPVQTEEPGAEPDPFEPADPEPSPEDEPDPLA